MGRSVLPKGGVLAVPESLVRRNAVFGRKVVRRAPEGPVRGKRGAMSKDGVPRLQRMRVGTTHDAWIEGYSEEDGRRARMNLKTKTFRGRPVVGSRVGL